jgi:hypothetical protein
MAKIDLLVQPMLNLNPDFQTGKILGSLKAANKRILLKSGLHVDYLYGIW